MSNNLQSNTLQSYFHISAAIIRSMGINGLSLEYGIKHGVDIFGFYRLRGHAMRQINPAELYLLKDRPNSDINHQLTHFSNF